MLTIKNILAILRYVNKSFHFIIIYPFPLIHEIRGFFFAENPGKKTRGKRFLGLDKIFFLFNICKQNFCKTMVYRVKSIEIKAMVKNVRKIKQFSLEHHKKFNKSNFLFYIYCFFGKVSYNE